MEFQIRYGAAGTARPGNDTGREYPAGQRDAEPPASLDAGETVAVLSAVGEAVYVWDLRSDQISWTENAASVLGVQSLADIRSGRSLAALFSPLNLANPYDLIVGSQERDTGSGVPYELCYSLHPSGSAEPCWIEDSGRWFAGEDGKAARATGIIRVMSERHRREQGLVQLSAIDSLTGGMNRTRLCQEIEEALQRSERDRTSFGFLLIGIDDLGRLNHAYGFDVVDQAIGVVARRLSERMRVSDTLGRFSNSRFGIVLHECDGDDLAVAASRFLNSVREQPIETTVGPIAVSVTAGGVIGPRHARSVVDVMGHAQEALDLAKAAGRGSFRAYFPSMESEARRRENLRLTDVILSALNERRVSVAYQPVVHSTTRHAAFQECLVRLCDVNGRQIDALSILSVAEKLDLVRLIDHRVLDLVTAALRKDPALRLSLNVSASTVHDPVWLSALAAELRGDIGPRLIIEITESAAIRDVEAARRFVASVKNHGCRVAIDDFGAGYTSFRNLRRLGVDMVKIDGSFVVNLEHAPDDRAFVRALLELARELGLETVAEWVQSEAAAAALVEWGCDYLQGALVGLAELQPDVETPVDAERPLAV